MCCPGYSKDIFLKSKMKHVVKYYVYLHVLLMGSIYVIKPFFKEETQFQVKQIFKSAAQYILGSFKGLL